MKTWPIVALMAAWLLAVPASAVAQTGIAAEAGTEPAHDWSVDLVPYLWISGLDGRVGLRGLPPASVSASFGDIVDHLDLGIFLAASVRRGPVSLLLDVGYLAQSAEAQLPGPVSSSVDVESDTLLGTSALAYRVPATGPATLDVFAGVRGWYLSTHLDLRAGALPARRVEGSHGWVDPVVGTAARYALGRRWSIGILGDVGGFGASSRLTWQVYGDVGVRLAEHVRMTVGYRYLMVDHEDDGVIWDVVLQGPLVGLDIRF